jgi:hypothetical protein
MDHDDIVGVCIDTAAYFELHGRTTVRSEKDRGLCAARRDRFECTTMAGGRWANRHFPDAVAAPAPQQSESRRELPQAVCRKGGICADLVGSLAAERPITSGAGGRFYSLLEERQSACFSFNYCTDKREAIRLGALSDAIAQYVQAVR